MEKETIVIIGNGMVGHKFCEKLIAKTQAYDILVFGEESRRAYDRVHLSEYFNGKSADELCLCSPDWYYENNITLFLNDPVKEIDRIHKTIYSRNGKVISYDKLVIATGSSAFVPNIPGLSKEGVFVYRTLDDLELIQNYAAGARQAAVMGGGLLGLEAAKALIDLGIEKTHVIEFAPRLMPRQIDVAGSDMLVSKLSQLGLSIHLNKSTVAVNGDQRITSLKFSDDTELPVDMLVISAGIRPRDELARLCGLAVSSRGGIIVDAQMQTSDPNIYAIGECALYDQMIYGLVAPGYEMNGCLKN